MSDLQRQVFSSAQFPHLRVVYHESEEERPGFYQFGDRHRGHYAGTLPKAALHALIVELIKEVERD